MWLTLLHFKEIPNIISESKHIDIEESIDMLSSRGLNDTHDRLAHGLQLFKYSKSVQ